MEEIILPEYWSQINGSASEDHHILDGIPDRNGKRYFIKP